MAAQGSSKFHDQKSEENNDGDADDDAGDVIATTTGIEAFDKEAKARDVESSGLKLGPPSEEFRTSLVDSTIAKKGGATTLNPGEALLQRLTSSPDKRRASSKDKSRAVIVGKDGAKFRTLASLEEEMLSPHKAKKETGSGDAGGGDEEGETKKQEAPVLVTKGKVAASAVVATEDSKEVAEGGTSTEEPQTQTTTGYPDPITELMNPGGHPGGYGMPQQHQQHHVQ